MLSAPASILTKYKPLASSKSIKLLFSIFLLIPSDLQKKKQKYHTVV